MAECAFDANVARKFLTDEQGHVDTAVAQLDTNNDGVIDDDEMEALGGNAPK